MSWIRTDIEIGLRIKCFNLNLEYLKRRWDLGKGWYVEIFEEIFNHLKMEGHFPKTSALVRVDMIPNKMAVAFWVQDSNYPPKEAGVTVEAEDMQLKIKKT